MQGIQKKDFRYCKESLAKNRRLSFKSTGVGFKQVNNSKYCGPDSYRDGRFHYQENIQFCRQSRGSLDETLEHMITAYDEKYIPKETLTEINKDYKDCLRQLNGYIKYLKTAKQGNNK